MTIVAAGGTGISQVEPPQAKTKPKVSVSKSDSKPGTAEPKGSSPSGQASAQQATQAALKAFRPGSSADEAKLESALWDQAMADAKRPQTLLQNAAQLNQAAATIKHDDHLPSNITPAELNVAWTGAEFTAAEKLLPLRTRQAIAMAARVAKQAPGSRDATVAASMLETATFNEEVLNYERNQPGLRYQVPGSAQWRKDAGEMLGNPAAVAAARATLVADHKAELSANGLGLPYFEAAVWSGETVAQARLAQRQGGDAQAVSTLAAALSDPNGDPTGSGLNLGIDPTLARPTLLANSYVTSLPQAINHAMKQAGTAGGIAFLANIVSKAIDNPPLASSIVDASKSTLQSEIDAQSGADPDQAAGAYVGLAKIYFAMKKAAQSGSAPAAADLAQQVARWSYGAINATSNIGAFNAHTGIISPSPHSLVLQAVIGQAKQQQVAGNLWQAWLQQAQAAGGPLATTSPDAAWIGFRQSLHGDRQLSARPLASAPLRAAPTAEELTQSLQAKQAAGQSLSEAIKATRAQMDVEYSDPHGDRNETLLAEAVLAMSGATYLNAYDNNATAANDPIERASTQIARLDVFDPTILQRATKTMTAMGAVHGAALQRDARRANAALQTWQADQAAKKPASVLGSDEQAYHAALASELNDVTGQTNEAWLNNPVDVDQVWKAEQKVETTNLALLHGSGDRQAFQTASANLQTSFMAVSILEDVSAMRHESGSAQAAAELTNDLSGLDQNEALYQEVMGDGSVQTLEGAALKSILEAGDAKGPPEARLAQETRLLAEYEGAPNQPGLLYVPLLRATETAAGTQALFKAVAPRSLPGEGNDDQKLAQVAAVLNPLRADPDLAAALYQEKFSGTGKASGVPNWITDASSASEAALGEIYSDIGGPDSAQGAGLRHALETRLDDGGPMGTLENTDGVAGERFGTGRMVWNYGLDQVKAAGQPMQLYQDIIDEETPTNAASEEIERETNFVRAAPPAKPINVAGEDPVGLFAPDGLNAVTTRAALINELGQVEGLSPARLPQTAAQQAALTAGQYAEYNLNQIVEGRTTLGEVLHSVLSASGGSRVSAQTPAVLAALPLNFSKDQSQTLGSTQSLSLLEIDGASGQLRYVGPASVTARDSYAAWQQYNGFSRGLMLVQPHLVVGSNGQALQGSAYWTSNQTGITTWDKVKSELEIAGGVAAMAFAVFVPEDAGLGWLLLADGLDGYFTVQSMQGVYEDVRGLATGSGRGDWVNWANLGINLFASSFGLGAAAGGLLSRAARITERIGVEVPEFLNTGVDEADAARIDGIQAAPEDDQVPKLSIQRGKQSYETARAAYEARLAAFADARKAYAGAVKKFEASARDLAAKVRLRAEAAKFSAAQREAAALERPVLVFKPTRLQRLLRGAVERNPTGLAEAVRSTDRLMGSLPYQVVGIGAMVTNAMSMGAQGVQMGIHGATPGDWVQLISNAALMGLGAKADRAHADSSDNVTIASAGKRGDAAEMASDTDLPQSSTTTPSSAESISADRASSLRGVSWPEEGPRALLPGPQRLALTAGPPLGDSRAQASSQLSTADATARADIGEPDANGDGAGTQGQSTAGNAETVGLGVAPAGHPGDVENSQPTLSGPVAATDGDAGEKPQDQASVAVDAPASSPDPSHLGEPAPVQATPDSALSDQAAFAAAAAPVGSTLDDRQQAGSNVDPSTDRPALQRGAAALGNASAGPGPNNEAETLSSSASALQSAATETDVFAPMARDPTSQDDGIANGRVDPNTADGEAQSLSTNELADGEDGPAVSAPAARGSDPNLEGRAVANASQGPRLVPVTRGVTSDVSAISEAQGASTDGAPRSGDLEAAAAGESSDAYRRLNSQQIPSDQNGIAGASDDGVNRLVARPDPGSGPAALSLVQKVFAKLRIASDLFDISVEARTPLSQEADGMRDGGAKLGSDAEDEGQPDADPEDAADADGRSPRADHPSAFAAAPNGDPQERAHEPSVVAAASTEDSLQRRRLSKSRSDAVLRSRRTHNDSRPADGRPLDNRPPGRPGERRRSRGTAGPSSARLPEPVGGGPATVHAARSESILLAEAGVPETDAEGSQDASGGRFPLEVTTPRPIEVRARGAGPGSSGPGGAEGEETPSGAGRAESGAQEGGAPQPQPQPQALSSQMPLNVLQETLFGPGRREEMLSGIAAAKRNDATSYFLPGVDVARLTGGLREAWRRALLATEGTQSPDLSRSDDALIRTLVGYVQANRIVMQEPDIGDGGPASQPGYSTFRLYHTADELDRGDFTQEENITRFLERLLSGAHFVIPRSPDSPDLYSHFRWGSLADFTRRIIGHSHYARLLGLKLNDGRSYPNEVKRDEAPTPSSIIAALLIGHTKKAETFFQLEAWPAVKLGGLAGRHYETYDLHKETEWNISTYGAGPFSEKQGRQEYGEYGRAIKLESTPSAQLALAYRAKAVAQELAPKQDRPTTPTERIKSQVFEHARNGAPTPDRVLLTDAQRDEFGRLRTELKERIRAQVLDAAHQRQENARDKALSAVSRQAGLDAAIAEATKRKATKSIVQEVGKTLAEDVTAGTTSAFAKPEFHPWEPPTMAERAAYRLEREGGTLTTEAALARQAEIRSHILGAFEALGKRGIASVAIPNASVKLSEIAERAAREQLRQNAQDSGQSSFDALVGHAVDEVIGQILPGLFNDVVYEAGAEEGQQLIASLKAQHPDASHEEIEKLAFTEMESRGQELTQRALSRVEQLIRPNAPLPDGIKVTTTSAGEYAAEVAARSSFADDVLQAARDAAGAGAAEAVRKSLRASLEVVAESARSRLAERDALPLPARIAKQVAADHQMHVGLWKARLGARRQVRTELRPGLQNLADEIAKRAVRKAFTWVTESEQLQAADDMRSSRQYGAYLSTRSLGEVANFVRAAALEAKDEGLSGTEDEYPYWAAEHIALQAVKANLTSGLTRSLKSFAALASSRARPAPDSDEIIKKRVAAEGHVLQKVLGRGVSRMRVEARMPEQRWKIWRLLLDSRVQSSGVGRLTRKTTLKAARWVARQSDFEQLVRNTAEQNIAEALRPAVDATIKDNLVAIVGGQEAVQSTAVERIARNALKVNSGIARAAARHAERVATREIRQRLPKAVFERNFIPDPDGKLRLAPTERVIHWLLEPFMHQVSYTAETYKELYEFLPERQREALPRPEDIRVDNFTLTLAEVPAGLEDIVADIHAHSMGYDRRRGNYFKALVDKSGESARILFGSIPQFCGGDPHYSTSTPSKGTMTRGFNLDGRVVNDWLRLYATDPEKAAKADLSITGVNFAETDWRRLGSWRRQAFRNPAKYVQKLLLKYPGLFVSIGEITGIKEMVTQQMGGWKWNANSRKFQNFLGLASETGQLVLLHNDWGEHGTSGAKRPSPAKQNYEHVDLLKFVFGRPEYRNVQIIFAHTGIGRLVRPNDAIYEAEHVIKNWQWDSKTGTGRVVGEPLRVKVTAPEHIHQLYDLFQAVPNARVDVSWNDAEQAIKDMKEVHSDYADSIVQFFVHHQDRILFGSDTVKPVNEGHYNQALLMGTPLFAEIARRDKEAVYKILRGNYEKALSGAEERVDRWTERRLVDRREQLRRQRHWLAASKVDRKLVELKDRRAVLDDLRESLRSKARTKFDTWFNQWADENGTLPEWSAQVKDNGNPGVFPALFKSLPESVTSRRGGPIGVGTSGGENNDSLWRRGGTALASGGFAFGAYKGGDWLIHHTGQLLTPTTGGGFTPTVPGYPGADTANSAAFLLRGGLILGRSLYTEKLRLQWERMFEQGVVTREGLDRYVSRLFNTASYLGITQLQHVQVAAITEQFWANYTRLRDMPIEPEKGWTEKQKFLALHSLVGEYQSTVSRESSLQESSINALDARRTNGRVFRGAMLLTYAINDAVAAKWLENGGFNVRAFADLVHPGLVNSQSAAEMSFHLLFGLGNLALGGREANSLFGGLFKITGTETNRLQRALQRWGTALLAGGGGAWTAGNALLAFHAMRAGDPYALDIVDTMLTSAFTYGAVKSADNEFNKAHAQPMRGPLRLATPSILLAGALIATEIIQLLTSQAPKQKVPKRPSPTKPPVPPVPPPVPPVPVPAAQQYLVTAASGLNVRKGPSLADPRRGAFEQGALVTRIGRGKVSADGEEWIEVVGRDSEGDKEQGWVASAFLVPYLKLYRTVVVRPGDTMSSIARENDVSLDRLKALNADHIRDPDLLVPGGVIYLPEPANTPRDEDHHLRIPAE